MMKKGLIPLAIIVLGMLLGWCAANLWADHVRESQPTGFDIGTRLTYQARGVAAGAIAGIIAALFTVAAIRRRPREEKSQNQQVHPIAGKPDSG
jgi:TRAP-type C4-dicarboxylate transport system permease small subunit